jgi:Uma2 family endonuclease
MAAALEPMLMTVDQYRQLPAAPGAVQELHWGQVITLTRPKAPHIKLQSRLVRLLRPKAEHLGYVESEVPFRALPEYDLRAADVAFIRRERWDSIGEGDLAGSPEIVIEVLSPSNNAAALKELAALCLTTGAEEFWAVDRNRKTVSVTRAAGGTIIYTIEDSIPLPLFNSALSVAQIFG